MPRADSPLIVGDYWLDKRRDGKSPDIWQIATYSDKSRSVVYRSTKRRAVEDAGAVLRSHEAAQRSKSRDQDAHHSDLLPHLFNYLREHEPDDEDDPSDPMDECGYIPGEGVCMLAGTEHCDWDCPFNPCDAEGI